MSPATLARWFAIQAFAFDAPGDVITFQDKLIRETRWTRHRAARAIEEYRRYLLLAAEAEVRAAAADAAAAEAWTRDGEAPC